MPLPACLEPQAGDTFRLRLKVQPRAARTALAGLAGSELKVRVAAPPVDDAANEALVRFLAERLDVPRSRVRLVRGRTGTHKVVEVTGVAPDRAATQLGLAG